jgi:hypothetical protein
VNQLYLVTKPSHVGGGGSMFIHYGEPPGTFDRGPGSLPQVIERGGRGRQVVKSRLHALNHRVEKWWHGSFPGLVLFRLVTPPL